jgi:hypothetical protein
MKRTWIAIAAAMMVMACASAQAQQQPAQSAPCAGAEFHQMDFWLGTWDARYANDPGAPPDGRNVITREYGGCVIQEQFDGGPAAQGLIGHSVSTFHRPMGKWRQTWVDNQGGYYALTGGPAGDDFVLENMRPSNNAPYMRMLFEEITADSFTWRWQQSTDAGATWSDQWVIYYTRRTS